MAAIGANSIANEDHFMFPPDLNFGNETFCVKVNKFQEDKRILRWCKTLFTFFIFLSSQAHESQSTQVFYMTLFVVRLLVISIVLFFTCKEKSFCTNMCQLLHTLWFYSIKKITVYDSIINKESFHMWLKN